MWEGVGKCVQVCSGVASVRGCGCVCEYAQVCMDEHGCICRYVGKRRCVLVCVWVCTGMHGYARVCIG